MRYGGNWGVVHQPLPPDGRSSDARPRAAPTSLSRPPARTRSRRVACSFGALPPLSRMAHRMYLIAGVVCHPRRSPCSRAYSPPVDQPTGRSPGRSAGSDHPVRRPCDADSPPPPIASKCQRPGQVDRAVLACVRAMPAQKSRRSSVPHVARTISLIATTVTSIHPGWCLVNTHFVLFL